MTMRMRKLIGAVALMVLVPLYVFFIVPVISLPVGSNRLLELFLYAFAGLAWVIPAGAIIWWMQRADLPPQ